MDEREDLGTTDYPQQFFKQRIVSLQRSVRSLEWNARNKKIGGCAACCFGTALVMFALSFGFTALLGHLIDNAIVGNAVVDSTVSTAPSPLPVLCRASFASAVTALRSRRQAEDFHLLHSFFRLRLSPLFAF